MYDTTEFVEFTNVGGTPVDMTGYSFSDSSRALPGSPEGWLTLTEFGVVEPQQSVVLTELSEDPFRADWLLDAVGEGHRQQRDRPRAGRRDQPLRRKVQAGGPAHLQRRGEAGPAHRPRQRLGAGLGPRATTWPARRCCRGRTTSRTRRATGHRPGTSTPPPASTTRSSYTADDEPTTVIRINEVESNGDAVEDWVELTNSGGAAVDISGWQLSDSGDNPRRLTIPSGTDDRSRGASTRSTPESSRGTASVSVAPTASPSRAPTTRPRTPTRGGSTRTRPTADAPTAPASFVTTVLPSRGAANICSPVRLNEVAANVDGTTTDQVELTNLSDSEVNLGGWVIKDSTDVGAMTSPGDLSVPADGFSVIEIDAELDVVDSVRLYDANGQLIDTTSWTESPTPSLGRCADGVGAFSSNESFTPSAPNACGGPVTRRPGRGPRRSDVTDVAGMFGTDASGVAFDPNDADTLWVVRNRDGRLFKMAKQRTALDLRGGLGRRRAPHDAGRWRHPRHRGSRRRSGRRGLRLLERDQLLGCDQQERRAPLRGLRATWRAPRALRPPTSGCSNGLLPGAGRQRGPRGPDLGAGLSCLTSSGYRTRTATPLQGGQLLGPRDRAVRRRGRGFGQALLLRSGPPHRSGAAERLRVATVDPQLFTTTTRRLRTSPTSSSTPSSRAVGRLRRRM